MGGGCSSALTAKKWNRNGEFYIILGLLVRFILKCKCKVVLIITLKFKWGVGGRGRGYTTAPPGYALE